MLNVPREPTPELLYQTLGVKEIELVLARLKIAQLESDQAVLTYKVQQLELHVQHLQQASRVEEG